MIFTWYFWAFYDIEGLEKYSFSCSVDCPKPIKILRSQIKDSRYSDAATKRFCQNP